MTPTDVLAIIGAITGTTGTVLALVALIWDYYKWKHNETVQLEVQAIPNFAYTLNPGQDYIRVMVKNIGKVSTTIKLITLHGFDSKRDMKKLPYGHSTAIVTPAIGTLPVKLNPTDDWDGFLLQDLEGIETYFKYKHFCVQIEDSMSKKPFRAEVDKSRIKTTRR